MEEILHQLRLVVYPIIYIRIFTHPRWWSPDFWTINCMLLGGGFKYFFIFTPKIGEDSQFWQAYFFHRGWFNHQRFFVETFEVHQQSSWLSQKPKEAWHGMAPGGTGWSLTRSSDPAKQMKGVSPPKFEEWFTWKWWCQFPSSGSPFFQFSFFQVLCSFLRVVFPANHGGSESVGPYRVCGLKAGPLFLIWFSIR